MKSLRKSSLITLIFLGIWLSTTFSYSMQPECCCFFQNKCRCSEKKHAELLSPRHKKHQEVKDHHQRKNQCHQEDNNCSCTKYCDYDAKEAVLKVYLTVKEKKQILALGQDILERKIPLPKTIVTYPERNPPSEFPSLFLLKSSFLL